MLRNEFSLFLGKSSDLLFSGFLTDNNFYMIVEIEKTSKETGNFFLALIKEKIRDVHITNLQIFEDIIANSLQTAKLPATLSLAAGYVKNDIAFLKTIGEGKIFLKREKNFAEIINGDRHASGNVVVDDMYIFGTSRFVSLFSSKESFKKIILATDVFTVVDSIYEEINDQSDDGVITLFLTPIEESEENHSSRIEETIVETGTETEISTSSKLKRSFFKLPSFLQKTETDPGSKKRILTIAVVIILFGILIWSVALGYVRRTEATMKSKVDTTKQSIVSKLNQAQDSFSSNPSHALELLADARKEYKLLETELGSQKKEELDSINKLITEKENSVVKKEAKHSDEFYDLSVDTKDAKSSYMYTNNEITALLDKHKKTVYILSLANRSLEKRVADEFQDASLVAYYEKEVYLFIRKKGIFTVTGDNKVKKIIDADKDWGSIKDLQIFNGNIYLLDSDKNDVYKYLVADGGYSNKQSYFKSEKQLKDADTMVIDSSLYINVQDSILKYNGGLKTDFSTVYPTGNVLIKKVYTSEKEEKVYVWNKEQGVVYILSKNGEYERQIQSDIMKKADDFAVYDKIMYFLSESKIYKITP